MKLLHKPLRECIFSTMTLVSFLAITVGICLAQREGWRPYPLNEIAGGSFKRQHIDCVAAMIRHIGIRNERPSAGVGGH